MGLSSTSPISIRITINQVYIEHRLKFTICSQWRMIPMKPDFIVSYLTGFLRFYFHSLIGIAILQYNRRINVRTNPIKI